MKKPKLSSPTPKLRSMKSMGRNKLCSCGSGLKFKKCCLFNAKAKEQAQLAALYETWKKLGEEDVESEEVEK